ncbi:MAG: CPBP family intramembrane glutamic endopeptidase [Fodinibius sp.]|nr:CPBP family intramembrane glutamic endopeptidase [Fodinibius sp.]
MHWKQLIEKWGLLLEAIVLFMGFPLLMFWDLIPLPKITVLLLVAAYCGYQLWGDPGFVRGFLNRNSSNNISRQLVMRLPLVIAVVAGFVWMLHPDQFFEFPIERPIIWMVVMVLYPFLSALPQEFIYRSYFFHRYEPLLPTRYAQVLVSALAFAFVHIIYDNWWAVGLSFGAGILFGLTYKRTESLFWVTLEHALYGCIVFTLGMGNYFYEAF